MKNEESEIILTSETREIVAAYLAKRQKEKKTISKKKPEFDYDFKKLRTK